MGSSFKDKILAVRNNPALVADVIFTDLEQQLDGKGTYDVPDASSPAVHSWECGVLMFSGGMDEMEAAMRKLYARQAMTTDDLYRHMSDDDYANRFATPVWTPFELYLPYDEVISKAVAYGEAGSRKLVIPRLTSVRVADHYFTMQYPIEMRVMAHGGLQVVYDVDSPSPIQALDSNMVEWKILTGKTANEGSTQRLLMLKVPMGQFQVTTYQEAVNAASAYDVSLSFPDQFYYARVYLSNSEGGWTPVQTTHTEQVFDPNTLTAVLKVVGNKLRVSFPVVYNTTGKLGGEVRIDIYTTRGEIDLDLGSYRDTQFLLNFNDIDDDTTYVAPLSTLSIQQALNPNRVIGGSGAMAFETLRSAVIDNTLGSSKVPITNVQLESSPLIRGYTLVSNVDNLTNRQFLASRRLPIPTNQSVVAGAGCIMAQLQLSMTEIANSVHVVDNGDRLTIKPSMLYRYDNGQVHYLNDAAIAQLLTSNAETQARASVESRFLYTPFHYVLDASENNFDVRPYYLDKPLIKNKTFIGENDSSLLQAGVDTYAIERIETGYRITVKLKSGDRFKAIADELITVQLGYKPVGETQYASINGTLVRTENQERVYQFDIETRFDIDAQNCLYTTNLSMYDAVQTDFGLYLEHDFDITILVTNSTLGTYNANELDNMVQTHLLPPEFMVLSRERLAVVLGYDMTSLWRRNRSIVSEQSYQRYENDVYYYYETNVYRRDANGQVEITINPDGSLNYVLEHAAGDPVMNGDEHVKKYLKGDVVIDPVTGDPLLVEDRKLLREITMFMVDGLYYFASEQNSIDYRNEIPMVILGWLQNDVTPIRKQLLEMCTLFLHPTTTFGDTVARVGEGIRATVTIDQALSITYHMAPAAYANTSIRPALVTSTKQIVSDLLSRTTLAVSDLITALKANAGEDVISVEVTGLGGNNNYPIMTLEDSAVRLALRKKLTVLTNQELMVEDDLDINFLRHSVS